MNCMIITIFDALATLFGNVHANEFEMRSEKRERR